MNYTYLSVSDTIVYENGFAESGEDLNSLTFLNLDEYTATNYQNNCSDMSSSIFSDMDTYKRLEVNNWRGEDCLDWAMEVCQRNDIDRNNVNLAAFRNVTGAELMNYSVYDFCLFDTVYGPVFYDEFHRLLANKGIVQTGQALTGTYGASLSGEEPAFSTVDSGLCDLTALEHDDDLSDFLRYMDQPGSPWDSIMHDKDDAIQSESTFPLDECATIKSEETCSEFSDDGTLDIPYSPEPMCVPGSDVLGKIRTKSRKRERGPKNWEFMIRLLVDKKYNPDLIRWEDHDLKTFRLVKPMIIAQMWGQRANKPNLSYDNFARGLRYQYTTGALKPVRERQLVYKCGPKALQFLKELEKEGY